MRMFIIIDITEIVIIMNTDFFSVFFMVNKFLKDKNEY